MEQNILSIMVNFIVNSHQKLGFDTDATTPDPGLWINKDDAILYAKAAMAGLKKAGYEIILKKTDVAVAE